MDSDFTDVNKQKEVKNIDPKLHNFFELMTLVRNLLKSTVDRIVVYFILFLDYFHYFFNFGLV